MNRKTCLNALVGAMLAAGAVSAHALTMTLNSQIGGDTTDVTYGPGQTYVGGGGGGFAGTLTGAGVHDQNPLLTYCVELNQDFNLPGSYSNYSLVTAAAQFGASKAADLSNLITWALSDSSTWFSDKDKSSGVQLAVWEIVYDTDLDLSTGSFHVNGGGQTNGSALAYANTLLSHASTAQSNAVTAYILTSAQNQDQLYWENSSGKQLTALDNAVPEPASLALVSVALAGLGFSRRRARG
jgi:hypothetical protein